jgi:hypothetical protein
MKPKFFLCLAAFGVLSSAAALAAQENFPNGKLDPTRNVSHPEPMDQGHTPLPEQYIWLASARAVPHRHMQADRSDNTAVYFRAAFQVGAEAPPEATLYIAGPRAVEAYVNGRLAEKIEQNPDLPLKFSVFAAKMGSLLRPGKNVLALKATPGVRLSSHRNDLVVKIVPGAEGVEAPALLISGPKWKATTDAGSGWQSTDFDDGGWPTVHAYGSIESSIDFFQANDDAGLYLWPGYLGASSFLVHMSLPVEKVEQVYPGEGSFSGLGSLTNPTSQERDPSTSSGQALKHPDPGQEFTVHLSGATVSFDQAPSLLLDFGREVTGRLELVSDSDRPMQVTVQYGESRDETLIQPYLGVDPLTILPHATAYGPKSAFRFAKVRFLGGGPDLKFRAIRLDDIYYPVEYRGSFESSDPLLNKIWEIGAYTSHLCMQDDVWDAPKRDRMRWAGDLDVSGLVIDDVFLDHFLMQDTMNRLVGNAPVTAHVNGIPGYSAWWIDTLYRYTLHTGSTEYLQSLHQRLVQLLHVMDAEVNEKNLFANKTNAWPFVDWSPELFGDTPEARRGTQFEYYLAYRDGAYLLRQLGDDSNARHYEERAQQLKQAAQKYLLDSATDTFGDRWQTNAAAIFSGVAKPSQYGAIWNRVLSTVGTTQYTAFFMTPYYNYYISSAMAETGHRREALAWIRKYWGGMVDEGATSFWEGYYPSWPKRNFHASLQADDGTGYYVSLAHGWSSGPTAWLMEEILGIQPTGPGFRMVTIRPDLAGLEWAKGAEPTPHGLLKVDLRESGGLTTTIDLPADERATVLVPVSSGQQVMVNGKAMKPVKTVENGARAEVVLSRPGHYVLEAR